MFRGVIFFAERLKLHSGARKISQGKNSILKLENTQKMMVTDIKHKIQKLENKN